MQTTSEFEEAAFSLAKGEISKPFFTPEGIHILKVIDRKEVPAYEVVSDSLLNRLRRQRWIKERKHRRTTEKGIPVYSEYGVFGGSIAERWNGADFVYHRRAGIYRGNV